MQQRHLMHPENTVLKAVHAPIYTFKWIPVVNDLLLLLNETILKGTLMTSHQHDMTSHIDKKSCQDVYNTF